MTILRQSSINHKCLSCVGCTFWWHMSIWHWSDFFCTFSVFRCREFILAVLKRNGVWEELWWGAPVGGGIQTLETGFGESLMLRTGSEISRAWTATGLWRVLGSRKARRLRLAASRLTTGDDAWWFLSLLPPGSQNFWANSNDPWVQ